MKYSFSCYGHENITARHKIKQFIKKLSNNKITITIETILNSNKKVINNKNTINRNNNEKNNINNSIKNNNNKNIINNGKDTENTKIIEKINAEINPGFNSNEEMVIRKTDFISERTFAIRADKAAFELSRVLISFLKAKKSRIKV